MLPGSNPDLHRGDGYLPVPPLLVSASGLESYLDALNRCLARDLTDVRKLVDTSREKAASAEANVRKIKKFLLLRTTEQMRNQLDDSLREVSLVHDDETDNDLDNFLRAGEFATEQDMLSGMMALARRVVHENARLREALERSTTASTTLIECHRSLKGQLEDMHSRLRLQQRDFHQLSLWLGTYDRETQSTVSVDGNNDGQGPSEGGPGPYGENTYFDEYKLQVPSDERADAYVAHSPLLLAFRRILLRDMTDRVTHTSDIQAKEVGVAVSGLKEEISHRVTTDRVVEIIEDRNSSGTQTVVAGFAKRLKEIEAHYVRKDEFLSSLKTKADTLLLPIKADSAEVTGLERKLYDKYADLEERVAYFEAERQEVRKVMKLLASVQGQDQIQFTEDRAISANSLPVSSSTHSARGVRQTRLHDVLMAQGASDGADPREMLPRDATHGGGKQIYRVIGVGRTQQDTSSECSPADGATVAVARKTVAARQNSERQATLQVDAAAAADQPSLSETVPTVLREAIGMTANQAAYAKFVSRELNRDQVESLPPLPYDRSKRTAM